MTPHHYHCHHFCQQPRSSRLVDLLDGWASTALITTTWHTTWHTTLRGTTSSLVHLGDDRVADSLKLLLHGLKLLLLGMVGSFEPLGSLVDLVLNLLLLLLGDGGLELLLVDGVLHGVAVRLEAVLGSDLLGCELVLLSELLGLTHHALNVILGETALVVGDGDVGLLARGTLVLGRHVQHTIGIDIECDLDLRHTTRGRRNPPELKLAEHVIVLGTGSLALVNLDEHTRLVVGVGGEGLGLLGWDGGVTSDECGHHTTSSLEAKGQRGNIEQQQVGVAS